MNETDIRKAAAQLAQALVDNDVPVIKLLSTELATQVLVDLNNISYQLTEIQLIMRNRD